jgi:CheY-like chemotaxis protein
MEGFVTEKRKILLIDDRIGDIRWLVDDLEYRGYEVDQVANERDAKLMLEEIRRNLDAGQESYSLAIVDIMVPIMDIMDLVDLEDDFYEDSAKTGIRLCRYAREELRISEDELPIVCLSSRSDEEEIRRELEEIGILKLFSRVPQSSKEDIRTYIGKNFPKADS